jgi:hypothetical protein
VGLLTGLGLGIGWQLPLLCRPLGLCPASTASPPLAAAASSTALARARQAAAAINAATSLQAYEAALADLDRELLRLWGDPLNPEQQRQKQQLQSTARDGQQRVSQERQQAQTVTQASERIEALPSLPAEQQTAERQILRQLLSAIPRRSFAHGAAQEQLQRLNTPPATAQPDPPVPPAAPSEATAPPQTMPPANPAPGWPASPPQPGPASAQPREDSGRQAPYRNDPLF